MMTFVSRSRPRGHTCPRYFGRVQGFMLALLFVLFATGCQVGHTSVRHASTKSASHWFEYTDQDMLDRVSDERLDRFLAEATQAYREERRWGLSLKHALSWTDSSPPTDRALPEISEQLKGTTRETYIKQAEMFYEVADAIVLWLENSESFGMFVAYATDDERWKGEKWHDAQRAQWTIEQLGDQHDQDRFFKEVSLVDAARGWPDFVDIRRKLSRAIVQ